MDLTLSPSSVVPDAIRDGNILTALPYVLLIILIVAAGFYQQVQTTRTSKKPEGEQSQTAQSMQNAMKIMPFFFGFISWTLTSGLGIYFATSNLFRIGQQALILRMDAGGDDDKGKPALPADTPPEDDETGKRGPSENASKKKNRRRRK